MTLKTLQQAQKNSINKTKTFSKVTRKDLSPNISLTKTPDATIMEKEKGVVQKSSVKINDV